jgi:2-(1,2-epoxy-1,2-dihydrophenyl)acetyl-CoA isomerase
VSGYEGLRVEIGPDYVATVEITRPPHNYFSFELIAAMADAFTSLDDDPDARVILLCSSGKSFCAGADFSVRQEKGAPSMYAEAVRLFANKKPIVAAVQGAAVGGGFGLAMMADFRVAAPEARFWGNFARLGFHHGFGLTVTLPRAVGYQVALEMLLTARRIGGEEAFEKGLCDRLVPLDRLRDEARSFALDIAQNGPLAVSAIRSTMRGDLAEQVIAATDHEGSHQRRLMVSEDFAEGVRAMRARRRPEFRAR